MKTEIRLCHLYPDLLNLYGDRGNILALQRRAEWRGIPFSVTPISLEDKYDPEAYNITFLGGGQDAEQNLLRSDLVVNKGPYIKKAIEAGKVFLCICGGYQMLGKYYEEQDGNRIECLGALNIWTTGRKDRFIGDTTYECSFLPTGNQILYGFENHSGRTYLGDGVRPLAFVLDGAGNNGEDKKEGAVYKNVYCTYSHGSFLPKNPAMTDYLLEKAIQTDLGEEYKIPFLRDEVEQIARTTCPNCKNS